MSKTLASMLNLETAWKRMKKDKSERNFVKHPYEVDMIELDLPGWLATLRNAVEEGRYNPSPAFICDKPKGNGAIRPAAHLTIADRVVYAACIGACYPFIYRAVNWPSERIDFSYILHDNEEDADWIRSTFTGWRDFGSRSIAKITQGYSHVVITDIAGYYENIDIMTLISDLRQAGAPKEAVDLISRCLNRWAQSPGRSIPQGQTPSDILAKLYFASIDQNLQSLGYSHYRYVDDIRIFCSSQIEAKQALVALTRLLRTRGLCVQSAKTKIHLGDDARHSIDGIRPIIRELLKETAVNNIPMFAHPAPYERPKTRPTEPPSQEDETTTADFDKAVSSPNEIIREAYQKYFMDTPGSSFDKSLFHFLLNRMREQKDAFAVEHCGTLFGTHPEETSEILEYIDGVGAIEQAQNFITNFIQSEEAIYSYQIYEVIEWLGSIHKKPTEQMLTVARRYGFDMSQPSFLRAVCRKMLGNYGTRADLERIENSFSEVSDILEQCEIICSLHRLETGRRNSFLGRCEKDSDLHLRATRLVKSGKLSV